MNLWLPILGLLSPLVLMAQAIGASKWPHFFGNGSLIAIYAMLVVFLVAIYRKSPQRTSRAFRPSRILFIGALLVAIGLHVPFDGFRQPSISFTYMVSLVFLAPLYEELVFRVIPLRAWSNTQIGSFVLALLLNAYFAFVHTWKLESLWTAKGVQHFVFGLALSLIYLRSRKWHLPVLIHCAGNFIGMFLK
jgi:membrane protease YdiL (CAAX protease family)